METLKIINDEIKSQPFHVIWHDKSFQMHSDNYEEAKVFYDKISKKFAKCFLSNFGVLDSNGGDYKQIVIGYGILKGLINLKTQKPFVVIWHDGKNNIFISENKIESYKKYQSLSSDYAKVLFENGKVKESYGGDYKYFCMSGVLDVLMED